MERLRLRRIIEISTCERDSQQVKVILIFEHNEIKIKFKNVKGFGVAW
jgi:hypothetical protein